MTNNKMKEWGKMEQVEHLGESNKDKRGLFILSFGDT